MIIDPAKLPREFDAGPLPLTDVARTLFRAAPAMLRLLASMSNRNGAPAKLDIDRMLQTFGIEIPRD